MVTVADCFAGKYNFHGQCFILRDTNGFEVCKLIPLRDVCCTPVSYPFYRSIKRTVAFPEGRTVRNSGREGIHQRAKYFAHGSRSVRSALNHLQFKDANESNGGFFEKKIKRIGCRSTVAIPKSRIQLAAKAQDALYTRLKFSERRMRRMHAQNRLPMIVSTYYKREINIYYFFLRAIANLRMWEEFK